MATASPHIYVNCLTKSFSINQSKIRTIAAKILSALDLERNELSVQFVTPRAIRTLNAQYRQKDKSTDVLAFPQIVWKKPLKVSSTKKSKMPVGPLGDIVISLENARKNAKEFGQSLDRETAFLLVHGILHLCGHDHHEATEEKCMRREQRKLMEILAQDKKPLWQTCAAKKARV